MTNGSWEPVWNKRGNFVEKYFKKEALDNECITVSTDGSPNNRFDNIPPTVTITYQSIRSKRRVNHQFHIPPQLLSSLRDETISWILKDLLDEARYDPPPEKES